MPEPESEEDKEIKKRRLIARILTIVIAIAAVGIILSLVYFGTNIYKRLFVKEEIPKVIVKKEVPPEEKVPYKEELLPEEDADSDGMSNQWEQKYGLNPRDPADALDDLDNDGLNSLQEYIYDTDPQNPDTDNDGYLDGKEVEYGYNPLGSGRLKEPLPKAVRLAELEGEWKGIISGAIYSSKDLALDLASDGKFQGNFTFTLEGKKVKNEISGQWDYNDKTSGFSAGITSKATLNKISGQYKFSFIGIVNKEASQVTGTWTGSPGPKTDWLEKDRGTFKLTKTE